MAAGISNLRNLVAERLDAGDAYPRMALLVALSGMFATTFPVTVLTLAIPDMADDMGVDTAYMAWVVTLPILCSALALPALGKLGDLYGHRRVFLTGFLVAIVTTFLSATASSAVVLIAWRTLSQTMGGATMPSSLALINSVHDGEGRARAMGWWAMVSAGAPVIGLLLGAPAIDAVGWQALFLLQACFMLVPITASWLVLRDTTRSTARFDIPGMITLAIGVGPLLFAVTEAQDKGLTDPFVLGCLAVAAVGLGAFARVEQRVPAPLLPATLVRSRTGAAALSSTFFASASYMGAFFLASLMMDDLFGYSASAAALVLAVRPVLFSATSPLGGRLTGRSGARLSTVAGCAALTVGVAGIAVGAALSSLVIVVVVGFIGQGIGFGLLRPGITTALANAVDESDLGIAGATERLAGQIGVSFGMAVLASVYAEDVDRFGPAFTLGALFGALALVCALGMRRGITTRPGSDEPESDPDEDRDGDRHQGSNGQDAFRTAEAAAADTTVA